MQVVGVVLAVSAAVGGGTAVYLTATSPSTVRPNVELAGVDLGGMTTAEASKALKSWWHAVADRPLVTHGEGLAKDPTGFTAASLGVEADLEATASGLPMEPFWPRVFRPWRGQKPAESKARPVLHIDAKGLQKLADAVVACRRATQPAKVAYADGTVSRTYEAVPLSLDMDAAAERLTEAILAGTDLQLPLVGGTKRVPDKELDKVKTVIGQYTTHFDAGNENRSSNIKLAAQYLSGRVLMPGEQFDFNGMLGQRTTSRGFKEAGVYVSGRHDRDVGGGICQVSTTLYNSVLQAGLKVVDRSAHSLPVAYVPLGQDATVSFPEPDFKFVNTLDVPVGIIAEYSPGQLTFRLLGATKEPGEVKIINKLVRSWSRGVKYVDDPDLAPGREVVQERGGTAREVMSWRTVVIDGQVVKKESLGLSTYTGGPRVVAINRRRPAEPASPQP